MTEHKEAVEQCEYCSIIDDDCPYENLKCDYCEVQKKVQEAKRLAEQMRKESHD